LSKLLAGYRVVESSMLLNGASTGMMLVDLGAEVVKIESPFLGDYIRLPETMQAHRQTNKGRRSLALDLRKDQGREILERLIASADVFVTNAVADRNRKLGLAYDQLKAIKPDIVYCQHTGFGATGPYAELPTHGQMMDSLAGALPVSLDADGFTRPNPRYLRRTGSMASGAEGTVAGAIYAAFHIASGLAHRAKTGEGCYIDVSSAEAVVATAWIAAAGQLNNPDRMGWWQDEANHRPVARYQSYQTRDGKFVLFCPEEKKFWEPFCDLVGRPDLKPQTRGVDLRREVQAIFHQRDRSAWLELAVEHRLPIGPIHETASEVRGDPQIAARGIFQEAGGSTFIGQPALVDGVRETPAATVPELGEHTAEVLAELGVTSAQIARFAAEEVTSARAHLSDHISNAIYSEPTEA